MLDLQGLRWRCQFMQALRAFFFERDYLEVDTPLRLPVLLPEAHIIPFPSQDWWLHTSPEQCMKRLLAAGAARLFQICHCFRAEERGRLHQPEFSMLEWYQAGCDYTDLMRDCEALLAFLATKLLHFPAFQQQGFLCWQDARIALEPPWERLSLEQAFRRYASLELHQALDAGRYEELLVNEIEPHLGWTRPLFLYDYPKNLGSLARAKADNPALVERFELYIAGMELANGFSELIDAQEQRVRFVDEIAAIQAQGRKAKLPEQFLTDLAHMPEAAGIALGLDRLLLLASNRTELAQVLPLSLDDL